MKYNVNRENVKVSILVSTYNWPEALDLVLKSMLNQTTLPYEIVIADDGSNDDTKNTIERLRKKCGIPIIHVWHEDKGFRKTIILNKAITKVTGDYILQVDGDAILSPHFVSDHLELAEQGYFVCGSRVKLSPSVTNQILQTKDFKIAKTNMPISFVFNSFRSKILRRFLALRYARNLEGHLRGCNMAFWKKDIIKVNGYNEDMILWGYEDSEIAYRLFYAGVKKKALKMGGNVYHLYHKEASRANERSNFSILEEEKEKHYAWCENGINKYL